MRAAIFKNKLGMMRYFITASRIFVQNRQSEILLADIKKLFSVHFGKKNILAFLKSMAVVLLSVREYLKCRMVNDVRVPKTSYRLFNGDHKHEDKLLKSQSKTVFLPPARYEQALFTEKIARR